MKSLILIISLLGFASVAALIIIGARLSEPTVVPNPYETGLKWDALQKEQIEAGWHVVIETPNVDTGNSDILVCAYDHEGKKLGNADVRLRLERVRIPLNKTDFTMKPAADGCFAARIFLPAPGRWDAAITVHHATQTIEFHDVIWARGRELSAPGEQ